VFIAGNAPPLLQTKARMVQPGMQQTRGFERSAMEDCAPAAYDKQASWIDPSAALTLSRAPQP
jgi:hypothetical protein